LGFGGAVFRQALRVFGGGFPAELLLGRDAGGRGVVVLVVLLVHGAHEARLTVQAEEEGLVTGAAEGEQRRPVEEIEPVFPLEIGDD